MTTLEALKARAAELYPYPSAFDPLVQSTFEEREAYVRAKIVSAKELEDAARDRSVRNGLDPDQRVTTVTGYTGKRWELDALELAKDFRAAGFYIEEG